jgi:hypothetical protein
LDVLIFVTELERVCSAVTARSPVKALASRHCVRRRFMRFGLAE